MLKITKVFNLVSIALDVLMIIIFVSLGCFFIIAPASVFEHSHISIDAVRASGYVFLFVAFCFLIMIGFSIIYNQKLKSAKEPNDLTGWSVVMIICGYFIVGVLGLLITDKDFEKEKSHEEIKKDPILSSSTSTIEGATVEEKLRKLKNLYNEGLITEEDYTSKRKELLEKL